jgi:hypothetical protein
LMTTWTLMPVLFAKGQGICSFPVSSEYRFSRYCLIFHYTLPPCRGQPAVAEIRQDLVHAPLPTLFFLNIRLSRKESSEKAALRRFQAINVDRAALSWYRGSKGDRARARITAKRDPRQEECKAQDFDRNGRKKRNGSLPGDGKCGSDVWQVLLPASPFLWGVLPHWPVN